MLVTIVESELSHVRELSKSIRKEDRQEAEGLGVQAHKALYNSFKYGLYRKTGLVDGKVAAMWGCSGTPMCEKGRIYLVTGTEVEKISPIRFAKIYKQELQEMKRLFPVLENYVDASYEGAVRMLKLVGFKIDEPSFIGYNNHPYSRFSVGVV